MYKSTAATHGGPSRGHLSKSQARIPLLHPPFGVQMKKWRQTTLTADRRVGIALAIGSLCVVGIIAYYQSLALQSPRLGHLVYELLLRAPALP